MLKKIFLLIFCLFIVLFSVAQQNNGYTVEEDSAKMYDNDYDEENEVEEEEIIKDNGDFGKEVLGDTSIFFNDFEYQKDSLQLLKNSKQYAWIKNLDSLLLDKQKKAQVPKKIKPYSGPSFFDKLFNSGILKLLLWALAIGFVGYILYQLFLSKGVFSKSTLKQVNTENDTQENDNIFDNDFDALQRKAYQAQDYRMAMRYLFLKTLKKLTEKELIIFAADKTNTNYMAELPEPKRNDFAKLALYYEYIWYGNVPVQQPIFDGIETTFNQFLIKL